MPKHGNKCVRALVDNVTGTYRYRYIECIDFVQHKETITQSMINMSV